MADHGWTLLASRYVAQYKIVRVREDRYRLAPQNAESDFVVCESPDWVLVIPWTDEGQVVFIHQYRHGVQQVVLELPGGVIDAGESPVETALRELREETGFTAERVRWLGRLWPNPALNTAGYHVCVADGCRRAHAPALELLEQIDVVLQPRAAVPDLIRRGDLCHAQVIAAFALEELMRSASPPPPRAEGGTSCPP